MRVPGTIVRRIAWWYLIPQLLLLSAIVFLFWKSFFPVLSLAALYGAIVYLLYSFNSKVILMRNHRRGMYLNRVESFRDAIEAFHLSYAFFKKYPWLDKYRCITMLDSSAVSYREMALCNMAYAHVQLAERAEARECYRRALEEFPGSDVAKNGLEYFESEGK